MDCRRTGYFKINSYISIECTVILLVVNIIDVTLMTNRFPERRNSHPKVQ